MVWWPLRYGCSFMSKRSQASTASLAVLFEDQSLICDCMHAQTISHVPHSASPRTVAHQAPLSMGLSRWEYQSRLPFPFPGDLPIPGIKPSSPVSSALVGRFFTTEPPGKPQHVIIFVLWFRCFGTICKQSGIWIKEENVSKKKKKKDMDY